MMPAPRRDSTTAEDILCEVAISVKGVFRSFSPIFVTYDLVIAGAGLAGAFSAYYASNEGSVLLLDPGGPAAGASGAAAGLVNPFMGVRARPVWKYGEALAALADALSSRDTRESVLADGILRPASSAEQAVHFIESAASFPDELAWLAPSELAERFPEVASEHGALMVRRGYGLDVGRLVTGMVRCAVEAGAIFLDGRAVSAWRDTGNHLDIALNNGETVQGRTLLLAVGAGFDRFDALRRLNLHAVKGQTVRVVGEGIWRAEGPCLSGAGYVVPDRDGFILGTTYEHRFEDAHPTIEGRQAILERCAGDLPGLRQARFAEARAGIRVTVPGTRKPVLGPLENGGRIWTFTGLGSKGLLMGALLGRNLPGYLRDPAGIPAEVALRLR
jgi:glycine/D-amino acid oxidase-like deaminating enzyme